MTLGHTNARHWLGDYVGWWINAFHMPLFFVLAGMCFDAARYPKFGQYLVRKFKALGWPYFALATFMAFLSTGLYLGTDPQWSLVGQLQPFLSCETRVNTFWFIKTLFEVEIVFWLLVKVICYRRGLILCTSLLFAAIGAFVIPEGEQVLKGNTLLVSMFYYALGYMVKDAMRSLANRRSLVLWGSGLGGDFGIFSPSRLLLSLYGWVLGLLVWEQGLVLPPVHSGDFRGVGSLDGYFAI